MAALYFQDHIVTFYEEIAKVRLVMYVCYIKLFAILIECNKKSRNETNLVDQLDVTLKTFLRRLKVIIVNYLREKICSIFFSYVPRNMLRKLCSGHT